MFQHEITIGCGFIQHRGAFQTAIMPEGSIDFTFFFTLDGIIYRESSLAQLCKTLT